MYSVFMKNIFKTPEGYKKKGLKKWKDRLCSQ